MHLCNRSMLPKHVRYVITRLCFFFNALCAKVVDVSRLNDPQQEIVVILCLLENYFSPSIVGIMLHLIVHLVTEVRLCGLVYMMIDLESRIIFIFLFCSFFSHEEWLRQLLAVN